MIRTEDQMSGWLVVQLSKRKWAVVAPASPLHVIHRISTGTGDIGYCKGELLFEGSRQECADFIQNSLVEKYSF